MVNAELLRLLPDAPPALCAILDGALRPVQPPIRSEIFGPQRFAQHGRSLGETHRAARARPSVATFFPRLKDNIRLLRQAHYYLGLQAATGYDISPAAEWLLDNFHLIEAQLREIRDGLPRSYFRALPMLLDEPLAGLPRVYGVAWAFVAHTDGAFDEALLRQFLAAYQETRELNLGEMWALPTTVRVVLVENLRRLAERVATHKAAREVANLCSDRIESFSLHDLDQLLALLERRGVGAVFLAQMAQRLNGRHSSNLARVHAWLASALPDPAAVQAQQVADQAADNLSVSNAVNSLRAIGDADWSDIVARSSLLMQRMLAAPLFAAEDAITRDQTLHRIEQLARRSGRSEREVAQALLERMQGAAADTPDAAVASHWLRGPGRAALWRALGLHERTSQLWRAAARRLVLPAYLGTLLAGTLGLVAWMLWRDGRGASPDGVVWIGIAGVLMLFPASEAVVALINRLISESTRPQSLPRLALAQGIPPQHRVMVAVPAMLNDAAAVDALLHRLLLHHLANPEPNAQFALLSDWTDAASPHTASDEALLLRARQGIRALNDRHPWAQGEAPRFVLLHRGRVFSTSEQCWIGWERKRGKLEALIARLAGAADGPFLDLGEESRVAAGTAYVVTLDSDTQLPPGRLRELVGVAAHPLNQPRLDAAARRVVGGYGILQPRIATPLPAPRQLTIFHWLFAGQCGIDPYSAASSEVYQDLFGEGSFTGKGLLHVQAMHAVLAGRLPEGRVLSHDLLEGSLARCAAVSDITLVEDAPFHADVAASRVRRWARGDWQLLPFMLDGVRYPLRAIHRWKMFDNLRRTLVAPMSLALLLLALAGHGLSPWAALGLVLAAFVSGPLISAVAGLSPSRDDIALQHFYRQAGLDLLRALCGAAWQLAQLLQQAMQSMDAIVRALYRMAVSRRHLLQWTTAAAAQASAPTDLASVLRQHRLEPLTAAALGVGLVITGTPHPAWTLALCTLWGLSPLWTWWVSRPRTPQRGLALAAVDALYLQNIARDTWRYFERCIGPQDLHLPPDNLQTAPHDMLARRTSPTNIGLYLLTVACARQFGWIGTIELLERLEASLASVATLQRHRGHLLNWYDTSNGAPLLPTYLSTVDSGNFCGHLLALAQACVELADAPFDCSALQRALAASRSRLAPLLAARKNLSPAQRDELRACLADHRATKRSAALDAQAQASDASQRLLALARSCQQLAVQADFSFLYHRKRHLFHIGYRVAEQELDAGFYDLLASESRLTSLFALAKGDVPVRHWASLGRPFFAAAADAGLRSWSGSMFEYLMPTLVLDEPQGSVLNQANRAALREQIAYADAQQLPWGISESAYAGNDHTLAYQYAPQGVPRLALRRTPGDEIVIAPYATALAAQIAPRRACRNFRALQALGARSRYGFIEALDFTPARQAGSAAFTPVQTFMAHHQGMSIVALANVLLDGAAQRWGGASATIEAVASLLHERAPREVSPLPAAADGPPVLVRERRASGLLREVLPGEAAVEPTHLLSNGRYGVALRANGAGLSRWGNTGITRWRDDALRDAHGSFFYLRWRAGARKDALLHPVSITQHPAPDPVAHYSSNFHADRVCFDAAWPGVQAHTTVWVSPEDDIEFRQVEISNLGERTLEIELLSAFEVTLSDARADEAHPAFMNLFVRAEWQPAARALWFERKPRLPTEAALRMAHFLADSEAQIVNIRVLAERQRWLGRNRDASQPLADFGTPAPASGAPQALDTGLDPVCAMAVRLRIAPMAKARLTFATAASDNEGTLRAVIDKYRQPSHVQRASLMSATLAGIRLRTLRVSAESFAAIQTLSTALVLSLTRPPFASGHGDTSGRDVCDRRLLWRFGISGDRPLLLVSAGAMHDLGLLRSLAQGLRLWSWGGIACDLVVVNSEGASYQMALQRELIALRERHAAESAAQPGLVATALHVLRRDELSDDELSTLRNLARVHLRADGRALLHQVQAWIAAHDLALEQRLEISTTALADAPDTATAPAASQGEFIAESGEFRFDVGTAQRPARPWINVLSNPGFGAQISEAGSGYSWAVNSRMNQLTAWSNDAVADPPSESFLIQDRRSRALWRVAPGSRCGLQDMPSGYRVAHGQGYTQISHHRGSLQVNVSWCVDPHSAVKQVRLRLVNRGHRTLQLRIAGIAEWMMGANRTDRGTVHTALHRQRLPAAHEAGGERRLTALLCTQRERATGFGEGTAFFALAGEAGEAEDWSCDRRELFDARGRLVLPDHLGQQQGSGLDPCAALTTRVTLAAGDTVERVFLLGYGENPDAARQLATTAAAVGATQRLDKVREHWNALLGATQVSTPDPLFDALVNRWLLYQTVSCRLWAKAGFYQAGGATGFRDQLQDAMALTWAAPEMLRKQILLGASRQFPEGDVQHWWHAPGGAGVRTHFSDDLLWLPFAISHYLRATGDAQLLDEPVPFIEGATIPDGAEDAYYVPTQSEQQATVYEHAARAIERSLRVGVHGLPLMGSGDWNDGMNRVGIEGRGESVWLGWFLCGVVADFAPRARARGELDRAQRWEQAAQGWRAALNGAAWDGQWFKRAFFDDGQPLGSASNVEGRIDLIAQAWSVLSGVAPPALQRMALGAVETHLVDREAGLVKLLDPPLQHAQPSAGYIQAYPPGVRENGGQYSHAGVWGLMAQARLQSTLAKSHPAMPNDPDIAYRYFKYLSPAHRARHATHGEAYGLEPYVMAGDVYSQVPFVGRGGWSWYTGAAAWLHRAAIESIFGLQLGAQRLCFMPCLPSGWPRAELCLKRDGRTMRFVFARDMQAETPAQAQRLLPGQMLAWTTLPPHSVFVVPLWDASQGAAATLDNLSGVPHSKRELQP